MSFSLFDVVTSASTGVAIVPLVVSLVCGACVTSPAARTAAVSMRLSSTGLSTLGAAWETGATLTSLAGTAGAGSTSFFSSFGVVMSFLPNSPPKTELRFAFLSVGPVASSLLVSAFTPCCSSCFFSAATVATGAVTNQLMFILTASI